MIKSLSGEKKGRKGIPGKEKIQWCLRDRKARHVLCLNSVWLENRKVEDIGVDGYIEVRF